MRKKWIKDIERFSFAIPATMLAWLDEESTRRYMDKSTLIRQLIAAEQARVARTHNGKVKVEA